jgi:tetratricopeptide (TPR) repeat protein
MVVDGRRRPGNAYWAGSDVIQRASLRQPVRIWLALSVDQRQTEQFSLSYLWYNFRFYFLEPMKWGGHFPFLKTVIPPPSPAGFWGVGAPYSGIMLNYPVVWLALAVPLAWRGRAMEESSALRWFVAVVFLLFLICALTMCLFFAASSRYQLEFLPALMLLAMIGIFGLEHALAGSPVWRCIARGSWCLLMAYSVAFGILAGVESHAWANYIAGNSLRNQGRTDEAIKHYKKSVALDPESATYRIDFGIAYRKAGRWDEAVTQFQKALETAPNSPEAQYDLGWGLLELGRGKEAVVHLQKALEIAPGFPDPDPEGSNNNIAWALATNPENSQRNGVLAVKLAESACQRTDYQVTIMIGTLAAAYAEAGRFDEAIRTAQQACKLAEKNGETNLLQSNQKLLTLYQNHQPYRERQVKSRD